MTQPTKMKIFAIPRIFMIPLLMRRVDLREYNFDIPIPDDVVVHSVHDNPIIGCFDFCVSSESFPEVPFGQQYMRHTANVVVNEKV